jgi:hypothetical protein
VKWKRKLSGEEPYAHGSENTIMYNASNSFIDPMQSHYKSREVLLENDEMTINLI